MPSFAQADSAGGAEGAKRAAKFDAVAALYHNLENLHPFVDGVGRTDVLILQMALSFIGMHPSSFYNAMESALCSKEQERQKLLEGIFRWEESLANQEKGVNPVTSWTLENIELKGQECQIAIAKLYAKPAPSASGLDVKQLAFVPDTIGKAGVVVPKPWDSTHSFPVSATRRWLHVSQRQRVQLSVKMRH